MTLSLLVQFRVNESQMRWVHEENAVDVTIPISPFCPLGPSWGQRAYNGNNGFISRAENWALPSIDAITCKAPSFRLRRVLASLSAPESSLNQAHQRGRRHQGERNTIKTKAGPLWFTWLPWKPIQRWLNGYNLGLRWASVWGGGPSLFKCTPITSSF